MSADDYYTPQWCIDAIVGEVNWNSLANFLEPCAGDGRIVSRVFEMCDVWQQAYDIEYPLNWEAQEVNLHKQDYLAHDQIPPHLYDLCLTNPPFSKWVEFAEKALRDCKSVIMLGKLSMLGTATRRDFWLRNQLSHMWCLSERPAFEGPARKRDEEAALAEGRKLSKTDNSEYAWFGWRCERIAWRPPGIYHI